LALEGGRGALVTVVRGEHAGARLLVGVNGERTGGLGDPALDRDAVELAHRLMWEERSELHGDLFVDVAAPPPRLLAFGAVEYASYLCRLAKVLGWRSYVIDPRAQFATPARFPEAVEVVAAWPERAFAQLGGIDPATYIVVLTHDPKIDDQVLVAALAAHPAYIGAMGSRRAQAARRERLLAAGVEESELSRIRAPIGLDLGAVGADEVALSIMAELVADRHGRAAGHLSEAGRNGGRIH
jgi:xanthine dehydrogenase accessory factor